MEPTTKEGGDPHQIATKGEEKGAGCKSTDTSVGSGKSHRARPSEHKQGPGPKPRGTHKRKKPTEMRARKIWRRVHLRTKEGGGTG